MVGLAAVAATTLVPAGTSLADPGPNSTTTSTSSITSIEINGTGGNHASSLTVNLDQEVTAAEATELLTTLTDGNGTVERDGEALVADVPLTEESTPTDKNTDGAPPTKSTKAGPSGERLLCNNYYSWSDSNGTFSLEHKCKGNTAPWGFWLSKKLRSIAAGPVTERGMDWVRNGKKMARQSPHTVPADYVFHGTFSNSPDGTRISYDDLFTFRHNLGPGGTVTLSIAGNFVLTGTPPDPPCRPGKPC
jgi:hypothetical protein